MKKKRVIDLLKKERKENQGKVCGSQKKKRKKRGRCFMRPAHSISIEKKKKKKNERRRRRLMKKKKRREKEDSGQPSLGD